MSCPECFSGHVNPGTPLGTIKDVYRLRTYVANPPAGKKPRGVIVVIPDAFGLPFVNNQILADHYASAGQYLVYLPDFMDGGAAPLRMMYNMAYLAESSWLWTPYYVTLMFADLLPHLYRNRLSVCWPRMTSFLTSLRADSSLSTLPVGVAGFCWGGLHAIMLTQTSSRADVHTADGRRPLVDAAFAAHPSAVTVPADFEKVVLPLSVAVGDEDTVFTVKQAREAKAVLEREGKENELVIYPGARHGFSIRASRSEPESKETRQAEEGERQAVAWFQKWFAKIT